MNLKSFLRTQLPAVLLLAGSAHAQTAVQGTVLSAEDKSPLPGATVVVEGTTRGTSAGADAMRWKPSRAKCSSSRSWDSRTGR